MSEGETSLTVRRELTREEAMAKVKETIDIVDRWYASDDLVPWFPPTSEDKERL